MILASSDAFSARIDTFFAFSYAHISACFAFAFFPYYAFMAIFAAFGTFFTCFYTGITRIGTFFRHFTGHWKPLN
ncbi:hypothetical protein HYX58_04295 [Candidatus Dependentiae bacterium]|nr:hypothetical protein [Candidatus Dependentiae bacterium]